MNKEPEELENWMTTWQATLESAQVRNGFQSKISRRRWMDYGSLLALAFGTLVTIHGTFVKPSLFVFAIALFFVPYFLWVGFRVWRRMRLESTALPLASNQYLKILQEDLELREKESRWEQKTIVPAVVAGGIYRTLAYRPWG